MAKIDARLTAKTKNVFAIRLNSFPSLLVHIVEDDFLHADPHMIGGVDDEQQHGDRDDRRTQNLYDRGVTMSEQRGDDEQQPDGQGNSGDRSHTLMPEMTGAGASRTQTVDATHRCAHGLRHFHRGPPMTR